jgi:hypothetical protein
MSLQNNPLKQYFRRPAVYVKLPSGGKYYEPGVVDFPEGGELPVYPMTAIDDITLRTPDALFNGTAVVELIKSCIPDVKDPWKINSIDLDALLIAIRSASGDSTLDIESECPSCNEVASYGVDLIRILGELKSADYDTELEVSDLKIKFRPLVYKEMNEAGVSQFEVQKIFAELENITDEVERNRRGKEGLQKVTEVTMRLLSQAIEYIQTPNARVDQKEYILDYLRNCDKEVYIRVRDYNTGIKSQTEIKPLKIKCVNCNHQYDQDFTLNASSFFG